MILLDTNALIWLETGDRRAKALAASSKRLFVSPASLLELQFLLELGRLKLRSRSFIRDFAEDERWTVDDPPSSAWFEEALELSWTHDPFDRLIVAHARARGWKLATGDERILESLEAKDVIAL